MDSTETRVTRATKLPEDAIAASSPAAASAAPAATHTRAGERSKEIPLEFPVEFEGVVYDKLTAQRLNGADLLKIKADTARNAIGGSQEAYLYATMCHVPVAVIEALDVDDFVSVTEATGDFLPRYVRMAAAPTGNSGQNTPQT